MATFFSKRANVLRHKNSRGNSEKRTISTRRLHMEPLEDRRLLSLASLAVDGHVFDPSNDITHEMWSWDYETQTLALTSYSGGAIVATFDDTTVGTNDPHTMTLDLGIDPESNELGSESQTLTTHVVSVAAGKDGIELTNGRLNLVGSNSLEIWGGIRVNGNDDGSTASNIQNDLTGDGAVYLNGRAVAAFVDTYAGLKTAVGQVATNGTGFIVVSDNLVYEGTAFADSVNVSGGRNITIVSSGDWTISSAGNKNTDGLQNGAIFYVGGQQYSTASTDCVLSLGTLTRLGTSTLTIDGGYKTLNSDGTITKRDYVVQPLVHVSGTFNLYSGVTLTNNYNSRNEETSNFNMVTSGGVYVSGPKTTDGTASQERMLKVDENDTPLSSENRAVFNMYGGTISNCRSERGGGVRNFGILNQYGGSIIGNEAAGNWCEGGGVLNNSYYFLKGGTVSDNICNSLAGQTNIYSHGKGGGVHNGVLAWMKIYGGTILGNKSLRGGGIYAGGNGYSTLIMTGGEIRKNYAEGFWSQKPKVGFLGDGGGIWTNATVALYGGEIYYIRRRPGTEMGSIFESRIVPTAWTHFW